MNNPYIIEERKIPLIPLRGISIFPHMVIHFDVGRDKSVQALEKSMMDDSLIMLCTQINPKVEEPGFDDFYHVGTMAKVKQMLKLPGGSIRVLVEGINRGKVKSLSQEEPYFEAIADIYSYESEDLEKNQDSEAAMRLVIEDLEEYIGLNPKVSSEVLYTIS
ncbi:MAG TPA: LON peptidase substrate-binding domain-containing protein, partial [Tissierellaceae bacterium]|nr:LON peptidase substrate-binding domain-containing protein [Tissierellaceae bacterium]